MVCKPLLFLAIILGNINIFFILSSYRNSQRHHKIFISGDTVILLKDFGPLKANIPSHKSFALQIVLNFQTREILYVWL